MDDDLDATWKALADPTRRGLLDLLRDGPQTTGHLAAAFPSLSRYAVMKHLGVLEAVGLVIANKQGRQRWNHLNAVPLKRIYDRWVSQYADHWATSLTRLKHITEQQGGSMAVELTGTAKVYKLLQEIEIDAPREVVFDALVAKFGEWWWRGEDGKGPPGVIEPFIGGRMFHDAGDGQGDLYGHVSFYEPPRMIRINGNFCNREASYTTVTVELDELDTSRTKVRLDHRSAGEADDAFMASFDQGWAWGLQRLKEFCETA